MTFSVTMVASLLEMLVSRSKDRYIHPGSNSTFIFYHGEKKIKWRELYVSTISTHHQADAQQSIQPKFSICTRSHSFTTYSMRWRSTLMSRHESVPKQHPKPVLRSINYWRPLPNTIGYRFWRSIP